MPEKVDVQLYKLSDVAVNNGIDGKPCWIIVKDSVYDVTNYLDDVSWNYKHFHFVKWHKTWGFYFIFIFQLLKASRRWWIDNWMGWTRRNERIRWFRSFGRREKIVKRIENWRTGWGNKSVYLANQWNSVVHICNRNCVSFSFFPTIRNSIDKKCCLSHYRRTGNLNEMLEMENRIKMFTQMWPRKRKVSKFAFVYKCCVLGACLSET